MNFFSSLTAASTPSPSTSQALFPSSVRRRHQVCHLIQYTFCVLPHTEASARVSTNLSTSSSFPLHPFVLGGIVRCVHGSAFRVIASHIVSSMYSIRKFRLSKCLEELATTVLYPALSIALVRVSAGFVGSFLWTISTSIPFATTFCTPRICFALTPTARDSSLPSSIGNEARLFCDPPQRFIHDLSLIHI